MNQTFQALKLDQDQRGLLTVTIDLPGKPHNVFDERLLTELHTLVGRLATDPAIKCVVFRSGKEAGFLAGADVHAIQKLRNAEDAEQISGVGQQLFDRIASLPQPTIAVIHGACLGGGLEFALACQHRIARHDSQTRLGLPEIELGILPAWGGTQRLPRVVGLYAALPMILQGRKLNAAEAKRIGLVDLAPLPAAFEDEIRRFVKDRLAGKRWKGARKGWLERLRDETRIGRALIFRGAKSRVAATAQHYPAAEQALGAIETGLTKSAEAGLTAERKALGELVFSSTSRSLMGLFFLRERARNIETWVDRNLAGPPREIKRIAVLGAGVMGAGIAQLAAYSGFQVVLKDVTDDLVAAGMERIRKLFDDAVRKGSLTRDEADARLKSVNGTTSWTELADVDLAIEAVTEREDVKLSVFRELDRQLKPEALIVSNTSALSVQHLAEATGRGVQVGGLHFFNPVHKMQLVEVVRAPVTNEQTIATLVSVVKRLGKVPVVVADSPGFLVNRILFPYFDEAVRLVCEGIPAAAIDREMKKFGMPMGPLELLDQVGLDVAAHVAKSLASFSTDGSPTPAKLQEMVDRGALGAKSGEGFYRYVHGKKQRPALDHRDAAVNDSDFRGPPGLTSVTRRLVLVLINEAAHCLGEQVVHDAGMLDLAMVFGTGFAPFRGGPLRLADEWGAASIVRGLEQLRQRFGDRFTPSTLLRQHAETGGTFHQAAAASPAAMCGAS